MKNLAARVLVFGLLFVWLSDLYAQKRRDPLTDDEVDQMREVADDPPRRIKLLLSFAKARLLAIEQLRGDPKLSEGRGQQLHGLLQDFANIIDELDRNLESYENRQTDLRKPLKLVIEGNTEFQLKLRALKVAAETEPAAVQESKMYEFVLEDAIDAVNASLDDARSMLEEQNAAVKAAEEAKKKKKD